MPTKVMDVYVEFEDPQQAKTVGADLCWPPPDSLVLRCAGDSNPHVLQILLRGDITPDQLAAFAQKIGAKRVTHNHQQLYP